MLCRVLMIKCSQLCYFFFFFFFVVGIFRLVYQVMIQGSPFRQLITLRSRALPSAFPAPFLPQPTPSALLFHVPSPYSSLP